ncbi:RDD family protein [Oceaniradius stylonematis]|uniref:RDD family protein n=1 Tax=Oceaniradius stylonematis TaxID=2184161 RepID=UPI00273E3767|nr:RDD family protein [Oceaniradius stylonematis]
MTQTDTIISTAPAGFDDWRLFEGVRTRRVLAFAVDYALVILLVALAVPVVGLLGVVTFGIAWLLYAVLAPLAALSYIAWTVGGPEQATLGMRMAGIRLVRYDGQPIDWMTAIVHAVLFWAANVILTPFIVLVALFTRHKRLLHDLALGTTVVRTERFLAVA